jgi:hypothetical protein
MTRFSLYSFFTVALVVVSACGPATPAKDPKAAGAFRANPKKARELLYRGEELAKNGKFDDARKLYAQAQRFADMRVREEIRVAGELTDEAQAKGLSEDIVNAAEEDRCQSALDDTMAVIRLRKSLERQIRESTSEAHYDCIYRKLGKDKTFAVARRLILSKAAKAAIWPKKYKRLKKKLKSKTARLVDKRVGEAVRGSDWQEALGQAMALSKSGKLGERDLRAVVKAVRAGIGKQVSRWQSKVQKKPAKSTAKRLERVRAMLALAWSKKFPGKLPAAMKRAERELAFWEVCRQRGCKGDAAEEKWTFGRVRVWPLLQPPAKAVRSWRRGAKKNPESAAEQNVRTLKTATKLWALFGAGDFVLVGRKEPKKGQHLVHSVHAAEGWVRAKRLRNEDTAQWLPPNDSIVGTRVWAPLRKGQKLLELGTVVEVKGRVFQVKRMADRVMVALPRSRAHFGITAAGTKALGYCSGSLTKLVPVEILKVKEPGLAADRDPLVTAACLSPDGKRSGVTKESQLGSLRMEKGWLPRRR